jgi:phosphoribosylaminoimidazole-succinocarboxamide synthase
MENGFQGRDGDTLPEIPDEFVNRVSERYIELYETITGEKFVKGDDSVDVNERIFNNVNSYLKEIL